MISSMVGGQAHPQLKIHDGRDKRTPTTRSRDIGYDARKMPNRDQRGLLLATSLPYKRTYPPAQRLVLITHQVTLPNPSPALLHPSLPSRTRPSTPIDSRSEGSLMAKNRRRTRKKRSTRSQCTSFQVLGQHPAMTTD